MTTLSIRQCTHIHINCTKCEHCSRQTNERRRAAVASSSAGYFKRCWCVPVPAPNASHMNFDMCGYGFMCISFSFAWYIFHIKYTHLMLTHYSMVLIVFSMVLCVFFSPCFYDRYILRLTHITSYFTGTQGFIRRKKMLSVYSRALSISHEIWCPMLLMCCTRTHFYNIHKH